MGINGDFKMEMSIVRMDDKFRVVIPKRLRECIGIFEKTCLYLYANESLIFLRKVDLEKIRLMESIEAIPLSK